MLQGSIGGPILFVLFINDPPLHVTNSDVDSYAHDSTLTFSSNLNISLNGAIIDQVKSHKLLGIHLDQDLHFDIQTEVLCKSF